jgi:hypothetical protein
LKAILTKKEFLRKENPVAQMRQILINNLKTEKLRLNCNFAGKSEKNDNSESAISFYGFDQNFIKTAQSERKI